MREPQPITLVQLAPKNILHPHVFYNAMIFPAKIKKIPDTPGIYIFKNARGKILYIGKATSLRSRVRSYFAGNILETRGPLLEQMVETAAKVEYIETDTVLDALILEAIYIKKHLPPHNTQEKDDKSFNFVVITNEEFPQILVIRGRELEKQYADSSMHKITFGPFPNGGSLKEAMKIVRRIFPYRDAKCVPASVQLAGLVGTGKLPKPCFNYQIGLCPGVCVGTVNAKEYARTIRHLILFFSGKKKQLLASLEKEMKMFAKNQEFERAAKVRKTVFALQHIQDVALIRRDKNISVAGRSRIEAYDIAHLGGDATAGVMTVVVDGEATPSEYRTFKIRQKTRGDDIAALKEVLTRRFAHQEWSMPSLIVIDGGQTHLKHAQETLTGLGVKIPVVSVVKDETHKAKDILNTDLALAALVKDHKNEILLANSESHRFAIKYHKKLRRNAFL